MTDKDLGYEQSRTARGSSKPIDFSRLLDGNPAAKDVAQSAEIAAATGDLVRRLRTTKGVSQAELARRIGSTQAHISDLERGIGRNGPTIATLARIASELGETLIVDAGNQQYRIAPNSADSSAVGRDTAQPGAANTTDLTVEALKAGMGKAAAGLSEAQDRMRTSLEQAVKTMDELTAFGQGDLEAVVKSGQIWVAGVQDLSQQVAASAQASFDATMAAFQTLAGVKSLKDAMDLQSKLARASLEKSLAESSRLTDASFKLTEQAIEPLTARISLAVQKFAKSA